MDVITVVIVDNKQVTVAATGGYEESAGEISRNLSGHELEINEEIVRSDRRRLARCNGQHVRDGSGDDVGWTGVVHGGVDRMLSRPQVRSLLVKMPLDHGDREGGVASNLGGREIRPCGEVAGVDGCAPRGNGRREHGSMVECNSVGYRGVMLGSGEEHFSWLRRKMERACWSRRVDEPQA